MIRLLFLMVACLIALVLMVGFRQQRVINDAVRVCHETNMARVERNESGEILREFLLEAQRARLAATSDVLSNRQAAAKYGNLASRIDPVEPREC